ncbi:hypothetical protein [Bifidobacterium callitrichidarum]|uniref:Uncharacterized protein n=1 Tax=Bifidobacterium callitrichidarum TaxID=2052941 RepID=A0A2U2N107_9BIFI|nr:hypothetical protein [Bifidobacterium callitrichidarum]PWG62654.1 hypothetical protein DF196_11895 [Bifidobacterium callitrichidarum]
MIESTPSQRTVLLRISDYNNKGRQYVKLASGYGVVYNQDPPITLLQSLGAHAARHNGRVLIPFSGHISIKNVIFCKHFIILATNGEYLAGDIVNAGENYRKGVTEDGEYTLPPEYMATKMKMWMRAKNVKVGQNFDPSPYVLDDFRDDSTTRPLADTINSSKCSAMIVYDLSIQEGADFYE